MSKRSIFFALSLVLIFVMTLFGCKSQNKNAAYLQISAKEAKALMESESGYVIIDARTEDEFSEGHIEGAILIPEYEVANRAEGIIPDKDTLILVYCRSGRRSKIAAEALVALGYTNVKEFGGIIDWPYETVK
jgi:rhodanese-related sulfurtransferase